MGTEPCPFLCCLGLPSFCYRSHTGLWRSCKAELFTLWPFKKKLVDPSCFLKEWELSVPWKRHGTVPLLHHHPAGSPRLAPVSFPLYSSSVCVLVGQSCLTVCDPMDDSPLGSSVPTILQARILEWVAISFSRRSSWPRDPTWVSFITGRFFTVWATREEMTSPLLQTLSKQTVELPRFSFRKQSLQAQTLHSPSSPGSPLGFSVLLWIHLAALSTPPDP